MKHSDEFQRCDIWLFRSRLFKSRALASDFIEHGKVRHERAGQVQKLTKASFGVRVCDHLIYTKSKTLFHVEILGLGNRRGPAHEAQDLYALKTK